MMFLFGTKLILLNLWWFCVYTSFSGSLLLYYPV